VTQDSADSRPIPIIYLIDSFVKGGGTENQLAVLVNNLDRRLFSPTIFTLRATDGTVPPEVSCAVHSLGVTKLISWQSWHALRQFVKFLRENRIGVLQLFFIDSNIFGVLAGMMAGIKAISISRRDMGWWYGGKRRLLTNLLNKRISLCIANAEAVKQVVASHEGIPPAKIEVIYNGVAEEHGSIASDIRTRFGIPAESPIVCIVANLKPIKRIDRFLRIAAALSSHSAHFVVIGQGRLKEELVRLAESLGIGSRTHFFSTVDEVNAVLTQSAVGVLTSESEGLSNALIEYALNGLPSVAFDVGGNSEVIINNETGFVIPPFDESAMAGAIDRILSDMELAMKMGNQARESARKRFSISAMTRRHEQVYQQVVNRART
jgi:L-malate glycosyltransferase